MSNDRIIGHPKEDQMRAFIYKCLIIDKMSKLKVKEALLNNFGVNIGATTVLNYYNGKMFWKEIEPHVDNIKESLIIDLSSGDLENNKADFCQSSYDSFVSEYTEKDFNTPKCLIEIAAEAYALMKGNNKAALEGRAAIKSDLVSNFTKLVKVLNDAK